MGLVVLLTFSIVPLCQTPSLGAGAIVNGASFASAGAANGALSPGAIVSAFGQNLATQTQSALSVPLSTQMNGSSLTFFVGSTAFPAPLFFVSAGQINAQLPFNVPTGNVTAQATLNGQTSQQQTFSVVPAAPGIFFNTDSSGVNRGAVLNQNFSANGPSNPEVRGNVLQIFCTGLGGTTPVAQAGAPGNSSPPFNNTNLVPSVTIGGQAAGVQFSALAPGFVGLYQVNAQINASTPTGTAVPMVMTINGVNSNTVMVSIQ